MSATPEQVEFSFPDEWKQSALGFTNEEPLFFDDLGTTARGLIRLPSGMVEFYVQDDHSSNPGIRAYSKLTIVSEGRVLERFWNRRYSFRFLVTLARRWEAERLHE